MNDLARTTVFLPGAGSFGTECQPIADALKPASFIVRYPGRYGRDFGIPAKSFDAVVRACAEQIVSQASACPVLFGHSYGAYVAYATALRLQEGGTGVRALVVAGASAPRFLQVSEQATCEHSDVARYLDRIDPNALAGAPSDDWREVVVEAALHDLRLLRQFDNSCTARVRCPVAALRGSADPLTTSAAISEWEQLTDSEFVLGVFAGGHSDFLRSAECVSWTRELVGKFR
ncbi:MAG TPA: alpha/beta fold hydrolase [Streptosporangiaceae bacterium]|nr:alpha/beta fold hydrolase [Streptosporangiaceae bacterium]